MTMRRRDFIKGCSVGLPLVTLAPSLLSNVALAANPAGALSTSPPTASARARVAFRLRARARKFTILPGRRTAVWSYDGRIVEGDPGRLTRLRGSYLGPVIELQRGERVAMRFVNRLREESVVHWHGLHVPELADGHPRLAVGPGRSYEVEFEVLNRAGTYWYHPHPHGRTGPQVYAGLAGVIIVRDEEEAAANLPAGRYDVPLVLQDRSFDSSNQLRYLATGPGMGGMSGMLGDTILVNGRWDASLEVDSRPYRLRLLNGSNSRIYKLAFDRDVPFRIIATDGGLLERPVRRPYVTLAPAERVELWVDFSGYDVGTAIGLRSLAFDGTGFGPGPAAGMEQGAPFDVMSFRVARAVEDPQPLPSRLATFGRLRLQDAVNAARPRRFAYAMRGPGTWTINGRTFQMEAVAVDETVTLGTMEAWDLSNDAAGSGMGMMGGAMPHPIHLHGQSFQIVDRTVDPRYRQAWESVSEGFVDDGWKDTVLVMPGERVRILRRFDDYRGLFLQHCHNLEHEDAGMMRNFRVV